MAYDTTRGLPLRGALGTVRLLGGRYAAYAGQRLLGVFDKPAEAALAVLHST